MRRRYMAPPSGLALTEACYIDAKGCHVHWMYLLWQRRQYMTPWDENALQITTRDNRGLW